MRPHGGALLCIAQRCLMPRMRRIHPAIVSRYVPNEGNWAKCHQAAWRGRDLMVAYFRILFISYLYPELT
jgi:hypothetical protein